jgi:cAMP phosphodiesterase
MMWAGINNLGVYTMSRILDVELFGVNQSARYQRVKSLLIDVLESTGRNYRIHDIDQIDKFLEEGLLFVPSIRINKNQVFHVACEEDAERVVQAIYDYIISQRQPTD